MDNDKGPKILVLVNDIAGITSSWEKLVSNLHVTLVATFSHEQFQQNYFSTDFDYVFIDIDSRSYDGTKLAIALRSWEALLNRKMVPLIGITQFATPTIRKIYREYGFNQIVSSPNDIIIKLTTDPS